MKTKGSLLILISLTLVLAVFNSCKRETPLNPYDAIVRPVDNDNPDVDDLPMGSFAWLHGKIFRPTCANSGCHDGTFEPEFRTIASAYHSLVQHPVIANDPDGTYEYRVVPGNANLSFLHARLTSFVPNTSGQMPLDYEPDSDWPANSTLYIQKITEWINTGAKDLYGNPAPPADINAAPLVYGIAVFPVGNTTTPYPRETNSPLGIGSIMVPPGLVDVWIFTFDDNAQTTGFTSIALKASDELAGFGDAPSVPFVLSAPINALLIDNSPSPFYYKATLDLSAAQPGEVWFLRNYIDDGVQTQLTEIPNSASAYFWYLLFSLKIT
jgi:hypothetical protein